jgi:hypothetical protein
MKHLSMILGLLSVAALTLASGVLHGRLTNRWGPPFAMREAAARLDQIPSQFGQWRLRQSRPLEPTAAEMLQCAGCLSRTYENHDGQAVDVTLLVGPSGPISVHTPEVCFSSQDFTVIEPRKRLSVQDSSGTKGEFWAVTFRANDLQARKLRVCYGWTTDGRWSAPPEPRFTFASSPHLYKIQLTAALLPGQSLKTGDPCQKFLQDFVPVARASIAPAAKP